MALKYLLLTLAAASVTPLVQAREAHDFGVKSGYRTDDLNWTIAGDLSGANPNILSELTYESQKIPQVAVFGKKYLDSGWYLEGDARYGVVLNGESRDSDYFGDNRSNEFSRSHADIAGDNIFDVSLGLGFQIYGRKFQNLWGRQASLAVIPVAGYSIYQQNIKVTNGVQLIDTVDGTSGPFPGLNSTYKAKWNGPWAGLRVEYDKDMHYGAWASAKYYKVNYEGEANWNLRSDFQHPKSFEHIANGTGLSVEAGVRFRVSKNFTLGLEITYARFNTGSGIDRTFFASGNHVETQFNGAEWDSIAIMINPYYRW